SSSGSIERVPQIGAAGVTHLWQVIRVPFLDNEVAVVNVVDFVGEIPRARNPGKFFANTTAHFSIVGELASPRIRNSYSREVVFVVVIEHLGSVGAEVAVEV